MPVNFLVRNQSRKKALANSRPPATAVARGTQSHSTSEAKANPAPTPARVR